MSSTLSGAPPGDDQAPLPAAVPVRMVPGAHDHDILTTAEASPRLGVFVDFMRAAALERTLLGPGPFIVFAPTDRAFQKLSLRERDALLAEPERLSRVMRSHIGQGTVLDLAAGREVTNLNGDTLRLTSRDGTAFVENARIVQTNIVASNGIIHAVDSLLF
ncbi:MAG TPA: fasciclin domain-containing protein [Gemmatimonadaceae bacterium]